MVSIAIGGMNEPSDNSADNAVIAAILANRTLQTATRPPVLPQD